ncbi:MULTISPECIES: NAD(P)-binding domain-containing protein [unclassified Streptomyces]|uniref:NADPH-dependent F420 reductase n=1 Tax=Streptomyces TaxID=1883 RepID=UPI0001C1C6E0|nr:MULTISPECIES: NAD(P)-binding domain-containing protein [unclassified Streptomyces]AEN08010.1 NADP oxidoreductase coenzyme F420-dependent [Streptomyces sp. SirexAA-E]MYR67625.1 NAD(P)-binding domain-containing protein [Streptomyces sp. SID4939]MYR98899.1 NAD(P)-binding domain-containing protein [Streptomyces sp. SID4940]MYT62094.1 NAD(P)-binding domain-containing protein [Streptomyces sp. SID8357]MYT68045.1 NAD(P)-binding domain-containing protein [Streptomyces sp. SID8357]
MKIGMLGAGAIAQAIARHAIRHGHEVVLSNSRGPASLAPLAKDLGALAAAAPPEEAAAADLVVLAVPWPQIPDAVAGFPRLDKTIVIDATNQFVSLSPRPEIADLGDLTGSEYVASLLPGARVVKAFNALYAQFIAPDPRHEAGRQVLFLAGDDADAKDTVKDLTSEFGFAPVDLGTLREGGRLIQLGGPLSALHALKQD